MNAVEIEEAVSDLAIQPFDSAEFPYQFLGAFGNKDSTIRRLKSGSTNKSDIGGVLQTNNIHIAVAKQGDVTDTLAKLKASPATSKAKAKYVLVTDGEIFEAEDLANGETIACKYSNFPDHFGFFLALAGITTVRQIRENAFDIKATSRLNRLYVELLKDNAEWATEERRQDMNHFMARLIFCFFAEDTDIFSGTELFTSTVERMSERDSSNTHTVIDQMFRAMNTEISDRAAHKIPRWANGFPYVNGNLFSGSLEVPRFSKIARSYLLHVGGLDWTKINPDIFGSMIQAVADDEERSELGMHYTSVPNILRVLNPLLLDKLREQLDEAGNNRRKLLNLRKRLAKIRVFDPACGSGNFLVIAYKQMREIENEVNARRGETGRKSSIPLTNYRGIELRSFSAEIARLALIIAEYQCDVLYIGQKEALVEFLPLESSNWIMCGNSLQLDWMQICPSEGVQVSFSANSVRNSTEDLAEIDFENSGGETYICGNPPYLGAKKKSVGQSRDMATVGLSKAQLLDYVCAFIVKGLEMIEKSGCSMALVTTSSICQGEQVSLIWPRIFNTSSIDFAYRPFRWANSAASNAGVFCTIIGLSRKGRAAKQLFGDEAVHHCESIAPYLIPGLPIICYPSANPISPRTKMVMGSNAVDGKRLILNGDERSKIIADWPDASRFIRRYGGTKEMLSGVHRWCVWISDEDLERALSIPPIRDIVNNCEAYRKNAGRDARKAAKRPYAFCYSTHKEEPFLHVGNTIGNAFDFVPADIRTRGYVSNHNAFVLYGAPLVEFSFVVSTLHRVWAETIAGRLGNGTRYGNTVVYNTFPIPTLTEKNRADLVDCAENILLSREAHFPMTIAELYVPGKMPQDLRDAHERNDEVLERIYIGRRFKNDTERLEVLFDLYTKMMTAQKSTSTEISL